MLSWKVTTNILSNVRGFTARCYARMIYEPYIEISAVLSKMNVTYTVEKCL